MLDRRVDPVRVTLPPAAWASAAIFALVALVFMGVAGYVFVDQLRTIREQDRKQAVLLERSSPVLDAARPVLRELDEQAAPSRDALKRSRRLLRSAVPLTEELQAAGVADVVRDLGGASRAITDGDRLQRTLTAALALSRDLRETRLVQRVPRTLDALVRRQDRLLAIQEETLAIQRRLIVAQEEALERLRGIDRRLGGGLDGSP